MLAIDTSSWWGSVALLESEEGKRPRVVAEAGAVVRQTHSVFLLDWIDELLARAEWTKASLDRYAAVRGPGSFTGIRIGLGTVRGLAMASGKAAVGVGALESIAGAYGPIPHPRHVVLDAGRGEVYRQAFDATSAPPLATASPEAVPPRVAIEKAERAGAWLIYQPPDGRYFGTAQASHPIRVGAPRNLAAAAGSIALQQGRLEDAEAAESLTPLYVRPPDAVVKPRS